MNKLILLLIIIACTIQCKDKGGRASEDAVGQEPSEDFKLFYEKFSEDTVFQLSSIVFPLEGMPSKKDEVDTIPADFRWQKNQWITHKKFDENNGTFKRSFLSMGDIITEIIQDGSGQFSMERRFAKTSDGWKLIYYREMGPF